MRTYGRVVVDEATQQTKWVVVETDANGSNDYVYATTIVQVLRLNLEESPFYGNFGIPAKQAVIQQVQPDFYVVRTQQYFSQFFASLLLSKISSSPPTYNISITTHQGTILQTQVAA